MDRPLAANHYGLGATPGDGQASGDGRAWLHRQLDHHDIVPASLTGQPSTADLMQLRATLKGQGLRQAEIQQHLDTFVEDERDARFEAATTSSTPLVERLVAFWANHFTVSAAKGPVAPLIGPYLREAIRPHALARFERLLVAVVQHPAMLLYLDNARSTGPGSRRGQRRGDGLNENLAREVLELHTLGARGGQQQADVIALARLLTGWTVDREGGSTTGFRFAPGLHEPGAKRLLGRSYGEGRAEGERALLDLARHPATARFVSAKLVRHLYGPQVTPEQLEHIAGVWASTGGNLHAVVGAIVDLPTPPAACLRTPWELSLAIGRGLELHQGRELHRLASRMGQPTDRAPSPKGWPDSASTWLGPEGVLARLDVANRVATLLRQQDIDPVERARALLGDRLDEQTRAALSAQPRRRALAMLVASAPFQWR